MFADDQRWDAMSVVNDAGRACPLPLDPHTQHGPSGRRGVRFRNAFVVNSLCSPSRASFLTGCYGYINGVVNNHTAFPVNNVTYATLLQKAGYVTGFVGKWHMGNQSGHRPGFDFSASFIGHGRYFDCPFEINGKSTPTRGWVDDVSTDLPDVHCENKDKPFCWPWGSVAPHPWTPPPPCWANLYGEKRAHTVPNLNIPAVY